MFFVCVRVSGGLYIVLFCIEKHFKPFLNAFLGRNIAVKLKWFTVTQLFLNNGSQIFLLYKEEVNENFEAVCKSFACQLSFISETFLYMFPLCLDPLLFFSFSLGRLSPCQFKTDISLPSSLIAEFLLKVEGMV